MRKYRRDGTPYPDTNDGLLEWAHDSSDRIKAIVRQETLPNGYWVSTVWLGIDHNWSSGGLPLIFETMVKTPQGEWSDFQDRYSTEEDAIIGHMKAVEEFHKL